MTLMGLILVVLYSGLRLGMRSWDAGEARAESVNELRLVHDFIRRRLAESVSVQRNDPDQGQIVVFTGEAQSLTLVTPMLSHLGLGGLYEVHFDLVEAGELGQLRMRWLPYRPDAEENEEVMETVLLAGVTEASWAYFGAADFDATPQWHESWSNPQQRPILVRLRLSVRGETWPAVVAALVD